MENSEVKYIHIGQRPRESGSESSANTAETKSEGTVTNDGTIRLSEATNWKDTAYAFSAARKWQILTVVALCQTSMSTFSLVSFLLRIIIYANLNH